MRRANEKPGEKCEYAFQRAPRCTAKSKRSGERCKAPAVRGWKVCRFHGARVGAPKGDSFRSNFTRSRSLFACLL